MLRMIYKSVVASTILFSVVCWGSRLNVVDANRLNQADQEGQWCCGGEGGHFDSSVRQEDAVEGVDDTKVWLSPSPQQSGGKEEHLHPETDCS